MATPPARGLPATLVAGLLAVAGAGCGGADALGAYAADLQAGVEAAQAEAEAHAAALARVSTLDDALGAEVRHAEAALAFHRQLAHVVSDAAACSDGTGALAEHLRALRADADDLLDRARAHALAQAEATELAAAREEEAAAAQDRAAVLDRMQGDLDALLGDAPRRACTAHDETAHLGGGWGPGPAVPDGGAASPGGTGEDLLHLFGGHCGGRDIHC